MAGIKEYSLTAANNTTINSISLAEGCAPSGINDAIRQEMADTRGFYECGGWIDLGLTHTYSSATAVTVASDVTASYVAGRRVKAVGSGTGTIYGVVASSSYSAPNTTINFTWDSGSLSNEALTVYAGWIVPTGYPINSTAIKGAAAGNMVNTGTPTAGQIPKYSDTSGTAIAPGYTLDTDGTMAANSDSNVATQKAVRTYVDAHSGVAFKNLLINGGMEINQRAAASNADDTYALDRWNVLTQTGAVAVTQLTDVENGTPFMSRITQSQASAQRFGYSQIVESYMGKPYRGQAMSLSARVRCSASTTLRYAILEWTGTADTVTSDVVNDWTSGTFTAGNFFLGSNLTVTATGSTALTANTLTTITTLTGTLGSSVNNLIVLFWTDSTQAQNVTLDIGKVQLEAASASTAFERLPYGEVLHLCKRYCQYFGGSSANEVAAFGQCYSTTNAIVGIVLSPSMRATPTLGSLTVGNWNLNNSAASAKNATAISLSAVNSSPRFAELDVTVASGLVAGDATQLFGNTTLSASLPFLSEL